MKYRSYLLIAITGLFAACSGNQKPVDLTKQNKQNTNKYKVSNVTEEALSSSATLPGQLVPFNEVNLFPKVNGFVKQLFVDRGSIVKKRPAIGNFSAPEMESESQLQFMNSHLFTSKGKCPGQYRKICTVKGGS